METRLGQAAPLVVAMEAILATCPLVADMEAVAEGPCVGCPVLSVWSWRAFLSCFVLSCLFSPGGLLIPPHFPREIWGGVVRVPAVGARPRGPRPRPRRPSAMASRAPSWSPELPAPPWVPELPAPPWSLSVCSALEVPVLCSCPCLS